VNPWQLAQQIKFELGKAVWPTGLGKVVFGTRSVFVYTGGQPDENIHPPRFPFALVTLGTGSPDDDDPDLLVQNFTIIVAVEVAGDTLGEHAVIGGARADYGTSTGAGVAEIATVVRATVGNLSAYDGASTIVSGSGVGGGGSLGTGKQLAFDEFTLEAVCTDQLAFRAPEQFKLVGDTWSWRGEWCSARFDFVQFRVGFVTSQNPQSTYTQADMEGFIYTGTGLEVAVPPVIGRVYYLFAVYNGHGTTSGAITDSSAAETGSYLVV
jgi:hypothetical protein